MPRGCYHVNWKNLASRIRDRDDHLCRICGSPGIECRLHVHHIDGEPANNQQSNLVSLCKDCHSSVHDEGYTPYNQDDVTSATPWGISEAICEDEWEELLSTSPKKRIGKLVVRSRVARIDSRQVAFPIPTIELPVIDGAMQKYSEFIHANGYVSFSSWASSQQ